MRSRIVGIVMLVLGVLGIWALGTNPADAPLTVWFGTAVFLVGGAYYLLTGRKAASIKEYLLEGKLNEDDYPDKIQLTNHAPERNTWKICPNAAKQRPLTILIVVVPVLLLFVAAYVSYELIEQTALDRGTKTALSKLIYWLMASIIVFFSAGAIIVFLKTYTKFLFRRGVQKPGSKRKMS